MKLAGARDSKNIFLPLFQATVATLLILDIQKYIQYFMFVRETLTASMDGIIAKKLAVGLSFNGGSEI